MCEKACAKTMINLCFCLSIKKYCKIFHRLSQNINKFFDQYLHNQSKILTSLDCWFCTQSTMLITTTKLNKIKGVL